MIERVRARRVKAGHDGLVELDKVLLYNRAVANGWNEFLGAIRTGTSLAPDIREFIICRVAVLNGAEYEWGHHAPLLERALKTDSQSLEGAVDGDAGSETVVGIVARLRDSSEHTWDLFNNGLEQLAEQKKVHYIALGHYVDDMTKSVKVSDETYRRLRECYAEGSEGDTQMVEITATCAAYNCVSRFLVALNVGDMN